MRKKSSVHVTVSILKTEKKKKKKKKKKTSGGAMKYVCSKQ